MHDDDSRSLEGSARADASPPTKRRPDDGEPSNARRTSSERRSDGSRSATEIRADGGTGWVDLTAFQRDCLEAVVRLEDDGEPCCEAEITHELECTYPTLNHNRLYPNLTVLVGHGLLGRRDRATDGQVEYTPTDAGRTLLRRRVERLADTCGLVMIDRAGDGTARGEGSKNG